MVKGRGASARSSPVVTPSRRSSGGCSSDVPNTTRGCSHVLIWFARSTFGFLVITKPTDMSSPSIDELDQHFRALKREIRQSFPSEDGPPSPKVRLLVEVLKHVNTKAKQVWSVRRQNRLRPDRHYNVGFALKCDLEILDHYLRIDGQFSTSTVVSDGLISLDRSH